MALEFQTDFEIGQAVISEGQRAERVTLQLSPSGDIVLVNKKNKLVQQMLRALVNDQTLIQNILNSTTIPTRYVKSLVTLILRNFRTSQILETRKTDSALLGYAIYRYNAGQNSNSFAKISPNSIQYKYVDTGVQNGITYTYAVTKIKANSVESAVMEKIEVTPTQFTNNQEPVIGTYIIGIPGNKSVTFYVDYNRLFSKQELLESIEDITVTQDPTEPRRWVVNVLVKSLDGNKVSISTSRFSITGK